ncbi:MAG: type II secretion system F family protein [Gemmataceae bacterium]
MTEWIWILLVAFPGAGLAFVGLQLVQLRGNEARVRDEDADEDVEPRLLFGSLTRQLDTSGVMSTDTRRALVKDLRAAGFYRPTAFMEFTAVRTALTLLPLLVGLGLSLVVDRTLISHALVGGVSLAAFGYAVPPFILVAMGRLRRGRIEQGLPVAIDLLALGLTGGQNLLSALERVSRELEFSYPVLAKELEIMFRHAELRSLDHALHQLADRVNIPEVRNLSLILSQSEKLGTDIASALLEFSNHFRLRIRQRAEGQANKLSFWMLLPALLCFWMPAGLILFGPIYFQFREESRKSRQAFQETQQEIRNGQERRSSGPRTLPTPPE